MSTLTTKDGTRLFYKDWGPRDSQPIVFHHGWPLSSDDWGNQMLFFLGHGYRVIAHDRRGHGRSDQTDTGNEMDTYAADVAELAEALDLKDAVHIGHSTGGGEVIRYVARSTPGRVAKAVLLGAVPPIMLATERYPGGLPMSVFDGFRDALSKNRAQLFLDVPSGPFYGFNRDGAEVSEGLIRNWWRQGMMGGAKAHFDCIAAFSETDFTEDLQAVSLPVLLMHGEDDQVVPIEASAHIAIELLPNGILKTYPGLSHGMFATHPDIINADLLAFIKAGDSRVSAVEDNPHERRFELPVEGSHEVAAAYYRVDGDRIVLTHTIVPESFSGQGLGSKLAYGTFEMIRASGRKAVLLCPFMAAYYARHPEYADIVAPESPHD